MRIQELVAKRRVLICVGSGGVGKTTVAASLGLAGARAGKRTLVLTIDPAKRLANALGLPSLGHEVQAVPAEKVALNGEAVSGSLDAMMLDQKRAFDEIVARYATDATTRARIYQNRIYQEISSRLTGSHEYAAMAKLYEVVQEGKYDLVVLDTPPTANALDFLEAPERVTAAVDSPAIQWFVKPYLAAGRFSLKAVGMGAAFVLKRLARFVGSDFLEDMAQFFVEFNTTLTGFRERATQVSNLMRQPDVSFILVSSAEPLSIDESLFFRDKLNEAEMPIGAFVVNRVHEPLAQPPGREAVLRALEARAELRGFSVDERVQVAADLERTYGEFATLATVDARQVERLRIPSRSKDEIPLVKVPLFESDVYDVDGLSKMVSSLLG